MKGIVFTEFLEMVEDKFGFEISDDILTNSDLESGGSYTAIGTYENSEMMTLVTALHKKTEIPVSDLLKVYGEHLFSRFRAMYGHFFDNAKDSFSFLESIDQYIHKEVLKLYPDAELPSFTTERTNPNELTMLYQSKRKMSDFAYGLILGCLSYFNEEADVKMDPLDDSGNKVLFTINKK